VCLNNLRQIGIALNNYAALTNCMPMDINPGNGHSFLVSILPYIEQRNLYNSINLGSEIPVTVMAVQISLYICPSDGRVNNLPGATNYAGNRGVGVQSFGYNGAFSFANSVRLSEVVDGLSNTAAVAEWLIGPLVGSIRDRQRSVFRTPNRLIAPGELDSFAAGCRDLDVNIATLTPAVIGIPWTHGEFGRSLYNHTMMVNENSCLNGGRWQEGAWTVKSNHSAGANCLFMDGRAKFIGSGINISLWRALGSRNGGEIVQDNAL
jgi:prepilin-type processing-associated H-X9-DG protein